MQDFRTVAEYSRKMTKKKGSRDKRDRLTFDISGLRDRLLAQAAEPGQSLASIVRMILLEGLEQREKKTDDRD
ncbi:MAG: hypothetical protein EAZ73_09290 [Oscillatoriales cyanobacterium]|nr:hypothetical protein [Microcoleus sp. PH2017_11_PCY_U_A]TAF00832.1 MAG: hypothetical protein EAZ79_01305 [Oscillatoriales cyanobacterium]TAF21409.1 MAG: hypothetical protein EAZ73_09290 [Oscillatoriales cyanobacterium]TAF39664.1 MAG: hypothetical protein EAZ69_00055 [Oscillatoriales cyanobacterium]